MTEKSVSAAGACGGCCRRNERHRAGLALGLAEAGADVVASARREALVDEVAGRSRREGRRTLRIATDVSTGGR